MHREYPFYRHVDLVKCWSCGRSLAMTPHYRTGDAHGNGAYRKQCCCGYWTWFDTDQFKEGDRNG